MSNEKEQGMPGSAPPPPPSTSLANGYSAPPGFPPQPPPYTQYTPGPMTIAGQAPFAYFAPPGTYPNMMPPGAIYHHAPPMAPPPYDSNQSQLGPSPPTATYPYGPIAGQLFPGQPHIYYPGFVPGQPTAMFPTYPMFLPAPPPPNMAVVMPDGFDPSARFDGVSRPSIPPPPPGVAPNMAQMALMYGQGNQVIVGQKKAGFF